MRMFFRDDVEARPVDDKEFEELDAIDELVRRQAHTHVTPLAIVLADWCCHPQAMLAVMTLERWRSWRWVVTFASESPAVILALCRDISSGRAAALHAALAAPLPAAAMPRRGGRSGKRPRSASASASEAAPADAAQSTERATSAARQDGGVEALGEAVAENMEAQSGGASAPQGSDCADGVLIIDTHGAQRTGLPGNAAACGPAHRSGALSQQSSATGSLFCPCAGRSAVHRTRMDVWPSWTTDLPARAVGDAFRYVQGQPLRV